MTARAIGLLLSLGIVFVLPSAEPPPQPAPPRKEPRASPGEGGLVFPLDRTSVPGPLGPSPGHNDTSEFMAGSVAVAVFLVESNGAAYDWSDSEVNQTLDGIYAGLSWWASQERKAPLAFSYELHVRPPTAWEPIQNPLSDDWIWIDGILADFGYTDAEPWAQALPFRRHPGAVPPQPVRPRLLRRAVADDVPIQLLGLQLRRLLPRCPRPRDGPHLLRHG